MVSLEHPGLNVAVFVGVMRCRLRWFWRFRIRKKCMPPQSSAQVAKPASKPSAKDSPSKWDEFWDVFVRRTEDSGIRSDCSHKTLFGV